MNNDEIVEQAARLLHSRYPDPVPTLSMPGSWRATGIELHFGRDQLVRLGPAGDASTEVEIFDGNGPTDHEVIDGYRSPDDLADRIAGIIARLGIATP